MNAIGFEGVKESGEKKRVVKVVVVLGFWGRTHFNGGLFEDMHGLFFTKVVVP